MFVQLDARIEGYSRRPNLLSRCGPARAGTHRLRVEPVTADGATGSLTYLFSADGFGPGCDPTVAPPSTRSTAPSACDGERPPPRPEN